MTTGQIVFKYILIIIGTPIATVILTYAASYAWHKGKQDAYEKAGKK